MGTSRFLLCLLLLASSARADEDGLSGGVTVESTPTQDESQSSMSVIVSEDARDAFENPLPKAQESAKKGPPARFDLENRTRFRSWIQGLCKLEPVSLEESSRARVNGSKKFFYSALNKQGSLQLLLENYVDDVKFEADCAQKRKHDAAACTDSSRLRNFSGGLDSLRTFRASKKANDLVKLVKEKRLARQTALKAEFFDLRDAGGLDGKATDKAEAILQALREDSNCRTRSVGFAAQK